jgi:hypothetical protein
MKAAGGENGCRGSETAIQSWFDEDKLIVIWSIWQYQYLVVDHAG